MNTPNHQDEVNDTAQAVAPDPPTAPTPETQQVSLPPPVAPAPPAPPAATGIPPRKSPGLAAVISVLPGLGHLYLGLYQRAVMIATGFALGIYVELPILVVFLLFFAIIDAYRQAQVINMGGIDTTPKPTQGTLGFGVFLTVVGLVLLINNFYPIDFDWLEDWWPAVIVLLGVWFILGALKERNDASKAALDSLYDDE